MSQSIFFLALLALGLDPAPEIDVPETPEIDVPEKPEIYDPVPESDFSDYNSSLLSRNRISRRLLKCAADISPECGLYKKQGYCKAHSEYFRYMTEKCASTCCNTPQSMLTDEAWEAINGTSSSKAHNTGANHGGHGAGFSVTDTVNGASNHFSGYGNHNSNNIYGTHGANHGGHAAHGTHGAGFSVTNNGGHGAHGAGFSVTNNGGHAAHGTHGAGFSVTNTVDGQSDYFSGHGNHNSNNIYGWGQAAQHSNNWQAAHQHPNYHQQWVADYNQAWSNIHR